MSDKPPKVCPGCDHPFHPAGNCRALEAGRCPCERNMAVVLDAAVTRHETWTYVRAAEIDALRAENKELKAEWREKDHAWIVRAEEYGAEIERLRAELARWKPTQCGKIYPVPVPDEPVEYCVREPDHGGAHMAKTGTSWVFASDKRA
jgi:hypothetical protein